MQFRVNLWLMLFCCCCCCCFHFIYYLFFPISIKPLDDSPGTPPSKGGSSDGPRQAPVQRRRFAKVQSYSSLEVVSTFGGMAVGGDSIPSTIKEEEDQKLPPLYEAFQLSLEVLLFLKYMYVCCSEI